MKRARAFHARGIASEFWKLVWVTCGFLALFAWAVQVGGRSYDLSEIYPAQVPVFAVSIGFLCHWPLWNRRLRLDYYAIGAAFSQVVWLVALDAKYDWGAVMPWLHLGFYLTAVKLRECWMAARYSYPPGLPRKRWRRKRSRSALQRWREARRREG